MNPFKVVRKVLLWVGNALFALLALASASPGPKPATGARSKSWPTSGKRSEVATMSSRPTEGENDVAL